MLIYIYIYCIFLIDCKILGTVFLQDINLIALQSSHLFIREQFALRQGSIKLLSRPNSTEFNQLQ